MRHLHITPEWQEAVIRAVITLKLFTYEETGAVLAALITSLPEAPGSTRNWDYRYCWLRDSYFTINALNKVNITDTMEQYLTFIFHLTEDYDVGDLQPLFSIHFDYWQKRADDVRAEIVERAWNEELQSFTENLAGTRMDASLLLMHQFGFIDPKDD